MTSEPTDDPAGFIDPDASRMQVQEWIDMPSETAGEALAREWLRRYLAPAWNKRMDGTNQWLAAHPVTCAWNGRRYRVVGASRLGDVWLKEPDSGIRPYYDHRVLVDELSDWEAAEGEKADPDGGREPCSDCPFRTGSPTRHQSETLALAKQGVGPMCHERVGPIIGGQTDCPGGDGCVGFHRWRSGEAGFSDPEVWDGGEEAKKD